MQGFPMSWTSSKRSSMRGHCLTAGQCLVLTTSSLSFARASSQGQQSTACPRRVPILPLLPLSPPQIASTWQPVAGKLFFRSASSSPAAAIGLTPTTI